MLTQAKLAVSVATGLSQAITEAGSTAVVTVTLPSAAALHGTPSGTVITPPHSASKDSAPAQAHAAPHHHQAEHHHHHQQQQQHQHPRSAQGGPHHRGTAAVSSIAINPAELSFANTGLSLTTASQVLSSISSVVGANPTVPAGAGAAASLNQSTHSNGTSNLTQAAYAAVASPPPPSVAHRSPTVTSAKTVAAAPRGQPPGFGALGVVPASSSPPTGSHNGHSNSNGGLQGNAGPQQHLDNSSGTLSHASSLGSNAPSTKGSAALEIDYGAGFGSVLSSRGRSSSSGSIELLAPGRLPNQQLNLTSSFSVTALSSTAPLQAHHRQQGSASSLHVPSRPHDEPPYRSRSYGDTSSYESVTSAFDPSASLRSNDASHVSWSHVSGSKASSSSSSVGHMPQGVTYADRTPPIGAHGTHTQAPPSETADDDFEDELLSAITAAQQGFVGDGTGHSVNGSPSLPVDLMSVPYSALPSNDHPQAASSYSFAAAAGRQVPNASSMHTGHRGQNVHHTPPQSQLQPVVAQSRMPGNAPHERSPPYTMSSVRPAPSQPIAMSGTAVRRPSYSSLSRSLDNPGNSTGTSSQSSHSPQQHPHQHAQQQQQQQQGYVPMSGYAVSNTAGTGTMTPVYGTPPSGGHLSHTSQSTGVLTPLIFDVSSGPSADARHVDSDSNARSRPSPVSAPIKVPSGTSPAGPIARPGPNHNMPYSSNLNGSAWPAVTLPSPLVLTQAKIPVVGSNTPLASVNSTTSAPGSATKTITPIGTRDPHSRNASLPQALSLTGSPALSSRSSVSVSSLPNLQGWSPSMTSVPLSAGHVPVLSGLGASAVASMGLPPPAIGAAMSVANGASSGAPATSSNASAAAGGANGSTADNRRLPVFSSLCTDPQAIAAAAAAAALAPTPLASSTGSVDQATPVATRSSKPTWSELLTAPAGTASNSALPQSRSSSLSSRSSGMSSSGVSVSPDSSNGHGADPSTPQLNKAITQVGSI